jgi:hypothetical protein
MSFRNSDGLLNLKYRFLRPAVSSFGNARYVWNQGKKTNGHVVCSPPHKKDAAHYKYLLPELSFVLIHISRPLLPPFLSFPAGLPVAAQHRAAHP